MPAWFRVENRSDGDGVRRRDCTGTQRVYPEYPVGKPSCSEDCWRWARGSGGWLWQSLARRKSHGPWPDIDWSATAVEIIYQDLVFHSVGVESGTPDWRGRSDLELGVSLLAASPRLGAAPCSTACWECSCLWWGGDIGLQQRYPSWVSGITKDSWIQGAAFAAMVLFATAVQWLLTRDPKKGEAKSPRPKM